MAGEILSRNPRQNYNPSTVEKEGRRFGVSAPLTERASTPTIPREAPQTDTPSPEKQPHKISSASQLQEAIAKKNIFEAFNRLAPPPTEADKAASNALEPSLETEVAKVGEIKRLKIGFAGILLATGGYVAYKEVPAVHRLVDSTFLNHLKGSSVSEASTTTDTRLVANTELDNGLTIDGKQTHQITLEQFKGVNIFSSYDPETQVFTYPFPFVLTEGVEVKFEKQSSSTSGPNVPFYHEKIAFQTNDGAPAEGVGIMTPDDGWHVVLTQGWKEHGQDPNSAISVGYFKYFPEQNVTVGISIIDPSVSLRPNLPMIDSRETKIRDYETQLPELPKGEIVAITTSKTTKPLNQMIYVYQGKNITPFERKIFKYADPKYLTNDNGEIPLVINK